MSRSGSSSSIVRLRLARSEIGLDQRLDRLGGLGGLLTELLDLVVLDLRQNFHGLRVLADFHIEIGQTVPCRDIFGRRRFDGFCDPAHQGQGLRLLIDMAVILDELRDGGECLRVRPQGIFPALPGPAR